MEQTECQGLVLRSVQVRHRAPVQQQCGQAEGGSLSVCRAAKQIPQPGQGGEEVIRVSKVIREEKLI